MARAGIGVMTQMPPFRDGLSEGPMHSANLKQRQFWKKKLRSPPKVVYEMFLFV